MLPRQITRVSVWAGTARGPAAGRTIATATKASKRSQVPVFLMSHRSSDIENPAFERILRSGIGKVNVSISIGHKEPLCSKPSIG